MNWNAFDLYTKLPATLHSSNEIARIGSLLQPFGSSSYDYMDKVVNHAARRAICCNVPSRTLRKFPISFIIQRVVDGDVETRRLLRIVIRDKRIDPEGLP
jgi:hypothetical protein